MARNRSKLYAQIIVLFLGATMILSSIGFIYVGGDQQKYKEAGYTFVVDQATGYLHTNVNNGLIESNFLPSQAGSIPLPEGLKDLLNNAVEVDMTSEPDDPLASSIALAQYELSRHLTQKNVFVRTGFTDIRAIPDQHQITCAQATTEVPVLWFKYGTETIISNEGNCFTVSAPTQDEFLRIKDRLLFAAYGIGN